MIKLIVYFTCIILWLSLPQMARALDPVAGSSAQLSAKKAVKIDTRSKKLRNFLLKYNSPLIPYTDEIVSLSDKHQLDYRLVVAISGVESTFCKAIPYNSYNCWGWKNGKHSFSSYKDALEKVSKTLGNHYYKRGLDTPETIAPVYAPPSKTWARNVRFFMNLMEENVSSTFLANQFSI